MSDDRGDDGAMERVTVRMPTWLVDELDELEELGIYRNRSLAVRSAVEIFCDDKLERDRW